LSHKKSQNNFKNYTIIMTEQLILKQLVQLPENLKQEVLDFMGYLIAKHQVKEKANEIKSTPKTLLSIEQKEFIDGMKESLQEVELHKQGKIKLPNIKDLINELENN
jgi:uncharacterized protein (UPF0305 family)